MKNNPLFTVITVCYNSQKTIKNTIESLLFQSFNDFEFIIIDGNSSDDTFEIIKSFDLKFKEKGIVYKYISEPDKGIYDAWNKGVKMSSGTWLSFIGSDDFYLNNALELYYTQIIDLDDDINISTDKKLEIVKLKNSFSSFAKTDSNAGLIKGLQLNFKNLDPTTKVLGSFFCHVI